jgi:hypothetical protein
MVAKAIQKKSEVTLLTLLISGNFAELYPVQWGGTISEYS